MKFCNNCKNHMTITEQKINKVRNIYYICKQCNSTQPTQNYNIFKKIYKKENNKNWVRNPEFSVIDLTLPKKHVKCTSCKKFNDNVYYQNNNLTITIVCSNCKHVWIYS